MSGLSQTGPTEREAWERTIASMRRPRHATAPTRKRPRRVQKKIDQRFGSGPRARAATLAELEWTRDQIVARGVLLVRHGDCKGRRWGDKPKRHDPDRRPIMPSIDRSVSSWLKSRDFPIERWPADWQSYPCGAGPIRNRAMLEGGGEVASVLFAFADGGKGTTGCVKAAQSLGIEVVMVPPAHEPRPWNMHHGEAPGSLTYAGRSPRHGGPSPLANPFTKSDIPDLARNLEAYKDRLWARISPASHEHDPAVLAALDEITADHFVGCTCWPGPCHVEVIIRAWRWRQAAGA